MTTDGFDFSEHAEEIARQNTDAFEWFVRSRLPGAEPEAPPVDLSLTVDEWLGSIVTEAKMRTRRRPSPAEKFAIARATVREHAEDDSLWPRLLSCYVVYGRKGAIGFLLGSEIPAEHIAAILKALPSVSLVRRLTESSPS